MTVMCIHVLLCCVRMLLWDCDVYTSVCCAVSGCCCGTVMCIHVFAVLCQDAAVGL